MHFTFFGRDSRPQRRLTRQRKLRHLTEIDIGGFPSGNHQSRPSASPSASPVPSWFKIGGDCYSLPVPSPELLELLVRRSSGSSSSSSSSNSGCFPLPSPKEAATGGDVEYADGPDSSNGDGMVGSKLTCQTASKCAEHVNKSLAGLSLNYGKKALQGQNHIENTRHNLWLCIPAKSAPSSGFLSPEDSPRRLSYVDSLPSAQMISPELQFWSAHKLPASDMPHSAQSSPEKFVASASHSPLHSPVGRSPSPNSNKQNRAASALHLKMPSDGSISWLDSKRVIAVHPLPLPPGGAGPLPQSASFHQAAVRQDALPMSSQWQKGRLIGSGTFGSVYIATNRETGALCAVKEVNLVPDDPKSAECIKQLEQEIKVLSQLKHQNIVQYYGSEIVDDHFCIYLEYVHPGSISKYVRDHCGAMTESVVRNFTRHILSGLAYLHSTKIIHRDIKGGNLLVDAAGVVKLADFGMAKHLTGKAAELSLKGSPYWMAPEVMQAMMNKDAEYDLAVDIWSLGCTIIEMFTGKPPWIELEWAAAMFKVLRNETPPIPETLSAEGKNFLQCCFQRNPADRPSASILLEHPFVKNSQHQEIPSFVQATSQLKSVDVQSPRDQMNFMQTSPGTMARKGKQSLNGESGQSHPNSSKSVLASRHSPRSTLEAIPSLSPPRTNQQIPSSSPCPYALKGRHLGTCNHRSFPLPKLREKHHIFSDAP